MAPRNFVEWPKELFVPYGNPIEFANEKGEFPQLSCISGIEKVMHYAEVEARLLER